MADNARLRGTALAGRLLVAARVLLAVPIITTLLLLVAGTFTVRTSDPRRAPWFEQVGLRSLAMLSVRLVLAVAPASRNADLALCL